jgi:hypothetical protein
MRIKDEFCYIYIPNLECLLIKEANIDISITENLSDNLYTMYEWEYKRFVVSQDTNMFPQRKENILNIIDNQIFPVLNKIIDSLGRVLKKWLNKHALLNPVLWAKERYKEDIEYHDNDTKTILESIAAEYSKYSPTAEEGFYNLFIETNIEFIQPYLKRILNDIIDNSIDDLDYYKSTENEEEIKRQENAVAYLQNLDLSNVEERIDFYKTYISDDMLDLDTIINYYSNNNFENMCINFMAKILFPLWFDYWATEGIVQTRKNIERLYKDLKEAKKLPFNEKITAIHTALNSTHQTGEMLDYINQDWADVDKQLLDELSNPDQATLNKWKQEILVG